MIERLLYFFAGATLFFGGFLLLGGLYTITPPNGPVDTAYKMNRITGKVWLVKTFSKQVGPIRVLTAREAEVEKTRPLVESEVTSASAGMVPHGGRN